MAVFQQQYALFDVPLAVQLCTVGGTLNRERQIYGMLQRAALRRGWTYTRVDTVDQQGFPDVLLIRGAEWWLIECKFLHKQRLHSITDDLKWQYGQIPVAMTLLRQKSPYMLLIGHSSNIAALTGVYENGIPYCADFVELL